jgi:hypothetical protein
MMLNSNIFIIHLLIFMWASIHCTSDLSGVSFSVSGCPVYAKLAPISVSMSAKKAAPVS